MEGLEIESHLAQFAAARCLQEGHSHVTVRSGGGDCRLHYDSSAFDEIVINLVLEWCTGGDQADLTSDLPTSDAGGIGRPQAGGGYTSAPRVNRDELFARQGDEHTFRWRFGQAMPRGLLALLMRARGGRARRGGSLCCRAARRLLSEAGFRDIETFWAVPEFGSLQIIRADARRSEARRRRGGLSRNTPEHAVADAPCARIPGQIHHARPDLPAAGTTS